MVLVPTFIVVGFPYIAALYIDIDSGNYAFQKKYDGIKFGISKDEVINQLGKPDDQSTEFHLSQHKGFEDEYSKAQKSNSKYYLYWYRSIDITYVIGFNDKDKAILKSHGGT